MVSAASLAALLACPVPARAQNAAQEEIVRERHELFTLAAMAYAYSRLYVTPKQGFDVAAALAWDIDDASKTPEFVIDRNRNLEKQGAIHHAEVNAIQSAYRRRYDHGIQRLTAKERIEAYASDLKTATIYTTLESCPMCQTTILMAGIPSAVYCFEDPGLRDASTRAPKFQAAEFAGKRVEQRASTLDVCKQGSEKLWKALEGPADGKHVFQARSGAKTLRVTQVLEDRGPDFFKPAYQALAEYKARRPENQPLVEALRKSVGKPLVVESLVEAALCGEYVRIDTSPHETLPRRPTDPESIKTIAAFHLAWIQAKSWPDDAAEGLAAAYRMEMRRLLDLPDPEPEVLERERRALSALTPVEADDSKPLPSPHRK